MPNRLIHERSPYLLQHAHNPVSWYPWGEEAFSRARKEEKPIFLSVGYSTCHWCHVMERESFENEEVATILNQHFVSIKVDREERPDVDRIYMTALQAMGQNGGWPMSMFLTPDLRPFYGGTYFPPVTRYGRAGFPDVLLRIHQAWEEEREKVQEAASTIFGFLQDVGATAQGRDPVGQDVVEECFQQLSHTYDPVFGGFGGGPKFPRPVVFNLLLRYHARTGNPVALEMTERTLQKMFLGGMYDHIGGGFHRYSVDGEWRVPHFEKMLYDQAQLVYAYVNLYLLTGNPLYAAVVRETVEYVRRDLTGEKGGFCSAEDADSPRPEDPREHGEGAYYVWTKQEVLDLLGKHGELFCHYYGIDQSGNAPFDPQQEFTGRNILYVAHSLEDTAREFRKEQYAVRRILAAAQRSLFEHRTKRQRPHLDDKILTGWNGLMIGALGRAGSALQKPEYITSAVRAAEFVLGNLVEKTSGRLLRRYRDGDARFEAHLADYAFFVQGLLDLYEADLRSMWLFKAIELAEQQIDLFHDREHGGFFDTSGRDPSILVRLKEQYDGAEPTGNSVAAMNLLRLSRITQNDEWARLAEGTIASFGPTLSKQPVVMPNMASAVDFNTQTPLQVIIVGRWDDPGSVALVREVQSRYLPNNVLVFLPEEGKDASPQMRFPWLKSYGMVGAEATAYCCSDFTCRLPTSDPQELRRQLDEISQPLKKKRRPTDQAPPPFLP